jgi:hypothetical protein
MKSAKSGKVGALDIRTVGFDVIHIHFFTMRALVRIGIRWADRFQALEMTGEIVGVFTALYQFTKARNACCQPKGRKSELFDSLGRGPNILSASESGTSVACFLSKRICLTAGTSSPERLTPRRLRPFIAFVLRKFFETSLGRLFFHGRTKIFRAILRQKAFEPAFSTNAPKPGPLLNRRLGWTK